MCVLFQFKIRFVEPSLRADKATQSIFADALTKLLGGNPSSVYMIQDSDRTMCGIDVSNANVRKLQHSQSVSSYAYDPANPSQFHKKHSSSSDMLDITVKSRDKYAEQDELSLQRKLGRYDGGLNDPTAKPTMRPTPRPTLSPTVAPDPVIFNLAIARNVLPGKGETPDSEETRISTTLHNAVSNGQFAGQLLSAASRANNDLFQYEPVVKDYYAVTTAAIAIGSRVIVDAPTSSPTSSSPTLEPTHQPATSRPTNPGETNRPTSSPSTSIPTGQPTMSPTGQPSRRPSSQPSSQPTNPTGAPTSIPTNYGLNEDPPPPSVLTGIIIGIVAGLIALIFAAYVFYTKYIIGDKLVKVTPHSIGDSEADSANPKDELDLSTALGLVIKRPPGFSAKSRYIHAKPLPPVTGLESKYIVFSAESKSTFNKEESKFELENDEESQSVAFRPMVRPLDYRSPTGDPRLNSAIHARMSNTLSGLGALPSPSSLSEQAVVPSQLYPGQSRSVIGTLRAPLIATQSSTGLEGRTSSFSTSLDRLAMSTNPNVQQLGSRTGINITSPMKAKKKTEHCFVFTKPQTDVKVARDMLFLTTSHFEHNNIRVICKGQCSGIEIAQRGIVDIQFADTKHYAQTATPSEIGKEMSASEHAIFESMGLPWSTALAENRIYTASRLCLALDINEEELYSDLWLKSKTQVKIRHGIYIARLDGVTDKYLHLELHNALSAATSVKKSKKQIKEEEEQACVEAAMLLAREAEIMQENLEASMEAATKSGGGDVFGAIAKPVNVNIIAEVKEKMKAKNMEQMNNIQVVSKSRGPIFVVNGFYGSMRNQYENPNAVVNWMVAEWDSSGLSWKSFNDDVLGCSNPAAASPFSIRGAVNTDWRRLGLGGPPTLRDNGVHASSSALEAMRERLLWISGTLLETDPLGSALLAARISAASIKMWIETNPMIFTTQKTIFDMAEGLGAAEVLALLVNILQAEGNAKKSFKANAAAGEGTEQRMNITSEGNSMKRSAKQSSATEKEKDVVTLPPLKNPSSKRMGEPKVAIDTFKVHEAVSQLASSSGIISKRDSAMERTLLYVKPHCNVPKVVNLIREILDVFGIRIIAEGKLISSAMIERDVFNRTYQEFVQNFEQFEPQELVLNDDEQSRFSAGFGGQMWDMLVRQKKLVSAKTMYEICNLDEVKLFDLGKKMPKTNTVRVRKGLYVTRFDELPPRSTRKPPMYAVNVFCGGLRNTYHAPNAVVSYFVIEWNSSVLSWQDYVHDVIGMNDPGEAEPSSIRGSIYGDWQRLGLPSEPNNLFNCVHGSNSALEGLRDRLTWIRGSLLLTDLFGARLLAERIPSAMIKKVIESKSTVEGMSLVRNECQDSGSQRCTEIILKLLNEGLI